MLFLFTKMINIKPSLFHCVQKGNGGRNKQGAINTQQDAINTQPSKGLGTGLEEMVNMNFTHALVNTTESRFSSKLGQRFQLTALKNNLS